MTLREIIAAHPNLFYPQTWYEGEPFMDIDHPPVVPPKDYRRHQSGEGADLPFAASLAWAYVRSPELDIWRQYLWCADLDSEGHRIYMGSNGKGMEIHRHLRITERWGVALW